MIDADFATWDIQANGGYIAFSQGNTIIEPEVVGTNPRRAVRSTSPARADTSSTVEFIFWSPDGSNPDLVPESSGVPALAYGVGTVSATLNDWVGSDPNAWSYCPHDGNIRNADAIVATLATATFGDKIGMTLDTNDITAPLLSIRKNGQPIGEITLPAGTYYYLATISGDPGTIALLGNSGEIPQYYGLSDGGWYLLIDRIAPILLASEPYISASTDSPKHEKYDGNLDDANRPLSISEGIRFWMDGPSAPAELGQGGLVQMQVNDPLANEDTPNRFSDLLDDTARGTIVQIGRNEFDGALTAEEGQYCGVIDRAEPDSLQTIQVYARDITTLLDKPLRRPVFMPDTPNQQTVALPLPICEGPVRNYEGVITSLDGKTRVLHDGAITGFGISRWNGGIPMIYGSDFAITADGAGVTLLKDPVSGKVTFETTSFGGAFDPDSTDYLAGCGDFTTATAAVHPPDAIVDVGYPKAAGVQWHGFSFPLFNSDPFQLKGTGTDKYIEAHNIAYAYAWIYQSDIQVRDGYTYAYSIDVRAIPYYGTSVLYESGAAVSEPPARLLWTWRSNTTGEFHAWAEFPLDHVGNYTGAFTNNLGADFDPVLLFISNGIITTTEVLQISDIKLNELPPAGQVETLDGPGLTRMVNAFAVKRGPLEAYQVNTDDTDVIDTATGYIYGLHVAETDEPSSRECLQELADSSNSAFFGDAKFALRWLRMFKPEDIDDADIDFELTRSDFIGNELIRLPDYAENLSARAQGCRNWSPYTAGDFAGATMVQVPAITRDQLSRDYQWTVTTGAKLHNRYREAYRRKPVPTLLDRKEHGQDFIDYACDPYTDERNFYRGTFLMPFGLNPQIGDVVRITHPSVTGGVQKLMLRGYSPKQPNAKRPTCNGIFWGL